MTQQFTQLLLERQALLQALVAFGIASAVGMFAFAWLTLSLWRRVVCLSEALVLAEVRHYSQQQRQLEQASNDRAYSMTQMLHGFEGIVKTARKN